MNVRKVATSQNDLHCYKILINKNGDLVSPFRQYFKWTLNKLYIDKQPIIKNKKRAGYIVITQGCFHVYYSLYQAKNLVERINKKHPDYKVIIYNTIIPKDCKYYSDDNGQICCKNIKIIDELCVY